MQILTDFEQMKLDMFIKRFGELSSIECLTLALEDEKTAKDCGPFDPAARRFYQSMHELLEYAVLQEKLGH